MSCVVRKYVFSIYKNKDADSLSSTQADKDNCFVLFR